MVACAWQGHRKFCRSGGQERRSGAKDSSPWFCPFTGQRPCAAKKPFFCLDFLLLVCFIKEKEEALPRRLSGPINSGTPNMRDAETMTG